MSHSSYNGGLDAFTLSDLSLYRWLEQRDDGWKELPDNREFARLEYTPKQKRLSRIRHKLRSFLPKRRLHAYQQV